VKYASFYHAYLAKFDALDRVNSFLQSVQAPIMVSCRASQESFVRAVEVSVCPLGELLIVLVASRHPDLSKFLIF